MRHITDIIIHCSATPPSADIGVAEIRKWHTDPKPKGRGWSDVGYHFIIRRDGTIEKGRPLERPGAHARGHNSNSIGICLVGGVDSSQAATCNFTRKQFANLSTLVDSLLQIHGPVRVIGHRDLSPDLNGDGTIDASERIKECPCFDVIHWMAAG